MAPASPAARSVNGGRLAINGRLGGSLDVGAGGVLGGNGTIGAGAGSRVAVGAGGVLSPGTPSAR